jgi:short-subunit dehydrogenase
VTEWVGKKYWVVGASEGLGEALAHLMSRAGAELILSSRSAEKLAEVVAALPGAARAVPCDIADGASVEKAAAEVGEIDGLVLTAAVYWPMSAREWDAEKAVAMADVNFTGFVRVLGHVVPKMVARDDGHIMLISSLTAFRGLPKSIGYTASKAAVLSLAECMHADLRGTGVRVQVTLPGFIRTAATDKNDFKMPFIMEPEAAAREVFELMNSDGFKKAFPMSMTSIIRSAQALPDALYYRLFS